MSANWDEVRNSIHEFFSTAAEKTDELIKVGRRKLSIAEIKRNITAQYAELGGRVYHLIRQGDVGSVGSDAEVETLVSNIQRLENDLKTKEMEIEEIRTSGGAPAETETVSASGASNKRDKTDVSEN